MVTEKEALRLLSVLLALVMPFLSNCTMNRVSFETVGEVSFKFSDTDTKMQEIRYYENEKNKYCVYLHPTKKKIEFSNLNSRNIDYSIPLDQFDSIRSLKEGVSFYVCNPDSVFLLFPHDRTIYLIGLDGGIVNQWTVNMELDHQNKEYVLLNMPQIPLFYQDGKIYVMAVRTDVLMRNPADRKTYFATLPDVRIDISGSSSSISNKTGKWPDIYGSGAGYRDYWPHRCIGGRGQVVYAYSIDHNLYVYDCDVLARKVKAKSEYFTPISAYPDSESGHFAYLKKYWVTEPRYIKIVYDPYNNLYYRIVAHAMEYEKSDGVTVNDTQDKPWSVMVLDSDFNVIDEVVFDPNVYSYAYFSVTKDGILISKRKKEGEAFSNNTDFTLFNISQTFQ